MKATLITLGAFAAAFLYALFIRLWIAFARGAKNEGDE